MTNDTCKHSPGRWRIYRSRASPSIAIRANRRLICKVHETEKAEANAHLIAAAPKMLKALIEAKMMMSEERWNAGGCEDKDCADCAVERDITDAILDAIGEDFWEPRERRKFSRHFRSQREES